MILEAHPALAALPKAEKLVLIRELLSSMRGGGTAERVGDDYFASRQAADDLAGIFHAGKKAAIEQWDSSSASRE